MPKTLGALEHRRPRYEPTTLALLQSLVPNQGQGWEYILGVLGRYYEQVSSEQHRLERIADPAGIARSARRPGAPPDVFEVVGAALRSAGRARHAAPARCTWRWPARPTDPAFAPEPLTTAELAELADKLKEHSAKVLGNRCATKLDLRWPNATGRWPSG